MIRIHFRDWEVVVCRPRRGIRILIMPQVIRISYFKFRECQWEVIVVLVLAVRHPRRGVKIHSKDIGILTNYGITTMISRLAKCNILVNKRDLFELIRRKQPEDVALSIEFVLGSDSTRCFLAIESSSCLPLSIC